jgi:hypothetical protein
MGQIDDLSTVHAIAWNFLGACFLQKYFSLMPPPQIRGFGFSKSVHPPC